MHKLIAHFGRNGYYDMRKGKLAIAPAEQEVIRTVVAECGASKRWSSIVTKWIISGNLKFIHSACRTE